MALPKISMEGALVRDPEPRFTGSGKAVLNVTVVCKDRVRGPNGEWVDGDPTFVDVTVWGKPAENLVESARKGDIVTVIGSLKQENWETKDGSQRSKLAVTADSVGVSVLFNPAKTPRAEGTYESGGPTHAAPAAGDDEPPF